MARCTLRFQSPLDNIHSIADAINLAISMGDQVFKDNPPPGATYNVVLSHAVARRLQAYCEQLHISANHIAQGDNRRGTIEEPDCRERE